MCSRFGLHCDLNAQVTEYQNDNDGLGMALEWLTGIGNRRQYFNQWDPMTQQLMQDPHIRQVTSLIEREYLPAGIYDSNKQPYKDPANPVSVGEDMTNYFTGSHFGGKAPVDGFLGSYDLTWAAVPTGSNSATVFFTVRNVTDNNSGLYHINQLIGHSIDFLVGRPVVGGQSGVPVADHDRVLTVDRHPPRGGDDARRGGKYRR
jgi:hypothetical protein